jgi:hypothetical protein
VKTATRKKSLILRQKSFGYAHKKKEEINGTNYHKTGSFKT